VDYPDLAQSLEDVDLVIGTSAKKAGSEKNHLRTYLKPAELAERLADFDGESALVFGREDVGLFNEELEQCDVLVSIPTSPEYQSMNLSHAVAVILYELYKQNPVQPRRTLTSVRERGLLKERFGALLDELGYDENKKGPAQQMFQNLVGRAVLSRWEFHRLMGILKRALNRSKAANDAGLPKIPDYTIEPIEED